MTLIYRGQAYTSSRTVLSVHAQTPFIYRGHPYQPSPGSGVSLKEKLLTYRGIPYATGQN